MANIGFHLNKSKIDKNGFSPIRAKISVINPEAPIKIFDNEGENLKNKERYKARYKTIDKVKHRYWNTKKQRVSPNREAEPYNRHKEINELINDFENKAKEFFSYCTSNRIKLTLAMVEDFYAGKMAYKKISKITFNQAFDEYIESGRQDRAYHTSRNYTTAKNYVFEFQQNTGYKLTFENIDPKFWDEFKKYSYELRSKFLEPDSTEKYRILLEPNTLAKYRNVLISFLNWAIDREYYSGTKHLKFKAPERNIDIIYLTEDELEKLYIHKFEDKSLNQVRDIFCLGCYTGLRYSDLMDLNNDHIQNGLITKRLIKTPTKVVEIPILPMTQDILDKYNYSFKSLPNYTDQFLNRCIKVCCQEAKIEQPLTITKYPGNKRLDITEPKHKFIVVHTARKTFINLAHKYSMPESLIMDIVGHSEYDTFIKYRKYEPEKKKEDMNKVFKEYVERVQEKKVNC